MCLAFPGKVIAINGKEGIVELAGNQFAVNLALLPGVEIGQYVLVRAGYAIQVVDEHSARETQNIFTPSGKSLTLPPKPDDLP